MLDIRLIRDDPAALDAALAKRRAAPESKAILAKDEARRAHVSKVQGAQSRRNTASKEIGQAMAQGDMAKADALKAEVGDLKTFLSEAEATERALTAELDDALARLPNMPLDDVPLGEDEAANVEVRMVGAKPNFAFDPKEHFELGEALGQMDFETAAKLSGSRFAVVSGGLARLERALGQFMLDVHTQEHGYTEVNPPLLVRDDAMFGTGQLPKFAEDLFWATSDASIRYATLSTELAQWKSLERQILGSIAKIPSDAELMRSIGMDPKLDVRETDDRRALASVNAKIVALMEHLAKTREENPTTLSRFALIPTAEVSLTNLVRDDIIDADTLPRRYTALTPCFRSEAGSAGRDTKGYLRQHQFYKVELVSITDEETSLAEHERMTKCAETILERLGLHFRTMVLCTGDMGFGARKTYDLEVWLPGQGAYREISSCSVCGDFQARRMKARYRSKDDAKDIRFVHTLNGSGVAVGRALIAVMENYQNEDGTITVPDVLKPYMGGLEVIG